MATPKKPSKEVQRNLPFEEAQGTHDERRSHLGLALMRIECDLTLRELVMMIFNTTHGGLPGHQLFKTYAELAKRPWGLCCSVSKARSTVGLAEHAGLITVEERRYNTGSVAGMEYSINWAGVNALLGFSVRRQREAAGVPTEHTPVSTEQTSVSAATHIRNTTSLKPVLKAGQEGGLAAREVSPAEGARAVRWDASARAYIETELAAVGLQRAKTLAKEFEHDLGLPAEQVVAICDEYRANRDRFKHAGAITYRLREGCWPVEGVLPVTQQRALAAKLQHESLLSEFGEVIRNGRRQGMTNAELTEVLRSQFPHALCDAEGWRAIHE